MVTQTSQPATQPLPARLNGEVRTYTWHWQGQPIRGVYEIVGTGHSVLLLPAFSTVSTRAELKQLADQLRTHFQVIALDWPGFGDSDRGPLNYRPELYRQFLTDFVESELTTPTAVIAVGHAAGYVVQVASQNPGFWSKIGLIAPTWRGPLAVMGAPKAVRNGVRELVRSPLLGQMLYGLNTRPDFLKWMYRRHVFVDATKLTEDYIQQRYQGTQQPGARYAPAAFVTGSLDPVPTREAFLADFEKLLVPVMIVVASQAPSGSKAEMEAIATLPNVQHIRHPGTLGMAEEFGNDLAAALLPFLQE
ncbi:MAG: alpha/beta fold hydrolase [Leptolyngbyaceae cyanobacterium]